MKSYITISPVDGNNEIRCPYCFGYINAADILSKLPPTEGWGEFEIACKCGHPAMASIFIRLKVIA